MFTILTGDVLNQKFLRNYLLTVCQLTEDDQGVWQREILPLLSKKVQLILYFDFDNIKSVIYNLYTHTHTHTHLISAI